MEPRLAHRMLARAPILVQGPSPRRSFCPYCVLVCPRLAYCIHLPLICPTRLLLHAALSGLEDSLGQMVAKAANVNLFSFRRI